VTLRPRSGFLKDHAHVVQAGDKTAAVNFPATRCSVAEAYDVGAALTQACGEHQLLCVINERHEPGKAVGVANPETGILHHAGSAPEFAKETERLGHGNHMKKYQITVGPDGIKMSIKALRIQASATAGNPVIHPNKLQAAE